VTVKTINLARDGMDEFPFLLVQVNCRRCRKPVGQWRANARGEGSWSRHHRQRCRCEPPVSLPEGNDLEELVARARRDPRPNGRAPVIVSR
jgi:hypothetical protein